MSRYSIFACQYTVSLFHRPPLLNNSIFSAKQGSAVFDPILTPPN